MPSPTQLADFGIALRRARERAALSQRALGAAVAKEEGLSEPITGQAVGLWERGASEPGRDRIATIERVLGLPSGELAQRLGYTFLAGEPIRMSASGVDLEELRTLDPEGYESIRTQAELLLRRARERKRARRRT